VGPMGPNSIMANLLAGPMDPTKVPPLDRACQIGDTIQIREFAPEFVLCPQIL
jgi:hypothetical protein